MKEFKSSLIHERLMDEALDLDPFIDKAKGLARKTVRGAKRILPGAKKRKAKAKAKETQDKAKETQSPQIKHTNRSAGSIPGRPPEDHYPGYYLEPANSHPWDARSGQPPRSRRQDSGYHGANQPVPSIDPELLDDSNAKITESRYKDPGEIADKIEKRQMGLYTAEDEELSPGGVVSPENRSKTTVYKHGKKVYDSDTATPAERKAFAKKSAESRKLTKDRTTRKGAFRARRPAGSGQVRPLVASKKKSSRKK